MEWIYLKKKYKVISTCQLTRASFWHYYAQPVTTLRNLFVQGYLPCLSSQYYSFNYLAVFFKSSFTFQVSFLVVPLSQPSLGAAPVTGKAQPGYHGLPVRGLRQGNGIIITTAIYLYQIPKGLWFWKMVRAFSFPEGWELHCGQKKAKFLGFKRQEERTKRDTRPTKHLLSDRLFIYAVYLSSMSHAFKKEQNRTDKWHTWGSLQSYFFQ